MERAAGTKEFVMCFDGTGYKFRGDDTDSNVLKIYRMLDRSEATQFHYYQAGFGTYVSATWSAGGTHISPLKRWYSGLKDAAFGSTFDQHVMAAYKFLMRFYAPGDKIYMFGFSRGAYIARILAEMLDHIGLLEEGDEEKVTYFWYIFTKWSKHAHSVDTPPEKQEKTFRFMKALRETFCRPVSRISFLGLFDSVNSVPSLEMRRDKFTFPFKVRTSARVIRHAVSIDERRAKFREDLMTDVNPLTRVARAGLKIHRHLHSKYHAELDPEHSRASEDHNLSEKEPENEPSMEEDEFYRVTPLCFRQAVDINPRHGRHADIEPQSRIPSLQPTTATATDSSTAGSTSAQLHSDTSEITGVCDNIPQDIQEIWFPGCHADIGGGLVLREQDDWPLAHVALVWMVHEAHRAGLKFDRQKLKLFHCFDDSPNNANCNINVPTNADNADSHPSNQEATAAGSQAEAPVRSEFEERLWRSSTQGRLHDFLRYGHGETWTTVLSWKVVEYLPFRRLALQKDGSWKSVRIPLPLGGNRDIPKDAIIHASAIRRMEADPKYRPKNLVRGGKGGRKKLPKGCAYGDWEVYTYQGCPVRETYRRKQVNGTRNGHP